MEKTKMEEQYNYENTETVVEETTETKVKKPFPKLPVIIGAAVAGVAIVAVLLILLLGGKSGEVALKEDAMPQAVFVCGEDIDLSSGMIVFEQNGKQVEVSMADPDVTVEGFDKNMLGEQTITVNYKGQSVQLTVTVVPRMQVIDYTTDYLVGDAFNLETGRLKITRNDGTNYTVMLKSDKVKVEGFSSAAAGEKSVNVTYNTGSETYNASFKVNVHNVEKVDLIKPTQVTYKSHDAGINLAGGILTLSALDGKVKKDVSVTADMISGFDLSAVNEANSPLTQTVTVNYDNKTFNFDVVITYTTVTMFKDNAHVVADLDWSGEEAPEITEDQGTTALRLMENYFDMSPAEQSLLSREEVLNMARTAIVYGFDVWAEDVLTFEGVFGVEYGEFVLYCESREAIERGIEQLQDTTRPIYTLYSVINNMVTTFGAGEEPENVYGYYYFSDYPTLDPEALAEFIEIFEYMTELDDLMDAVGADWNEGDNILLYADEIEAVYNSIINSEFYSYSYAQFFYYVSTWRANNDAFDFLYTYFYDVETNVDAIMNIANIRLPVELEEIFAHVYGAITQMDYIQNWQYYMIYYGEYFIDTTQFFYHYSQAIELSKQLIASENEMLIVLYLYLPLNSMLGVDATGDMYYFDGMIEQLATTAGGYYALCGALLEVEEFHVLMNKYLSIIDKTFDDEEYSKTEEYAAEVREMFALYMQLTPAQQYTFLGTLSIFYSGGMLSYAFDNRGEYGDLTCMFVDMVNTVYQDMFETDEAKDAYMQLILATELYAQRYTKAEWLTEFRTKMEAVAAAYANMSGADLDAFNTHLFQVYSDYTKILEKYSVEEEQPVDLGEWADKFVELEQAVIAVEFSYMFFQAGQPIYSLFYTAFEKAQSIYNDILMYAPDEIKYILVHEALYSNKSLENFLASREDGEGDGILDTEGSEGTEETPEEFWSFDYVLSVYSAVYINGLLDLDGASVYDYYVGWEMSEFMLKAYDLIWSMMWTAEGQAEKYDKAAVIAAMEHFANMDAEAQIFFIFYLDYYTDEEDPLYYQAITDFLNTAGYLENVVNAVQLLVSLEMNSMYYNYLAPYVESGDLSAADMQEIVDEVVDSYEKFLAVYETLTEEELAQFADFANVYEFYKTFVEKLIAE